MLTTEVQSLEAELSIGGMTCSACAARVQKKLNAIDGVTATVNFATERASVVAAPGITLPQLIAAVERAGYTAADARPPAEAGEGQGEPGGGQAG